MKKIEQITCSILIALALVFSGCSKDDDQGGGGGSAATGTIGAKVNGNDFTSSSMLTLASKSQSGDNTILTVQGSDNSGKTIRLIIIGFDGAKTYTIEGGTGGTVSATYLEANASNPADSKAWQGVSGNIVVTDNSGTNVKGTFDFTGENIGDDSVVEVTEGSFNIDIQ